MKKPRNEPDTQPASRGREHQNTNKLFSVFEINIDSLRIADYMKTPETFQQYS